MSGYHDLSENAKKSCFTQVSPNQKDRTPIMTETTRKTSEAGNGSMKITVSKNGPYIVTGGVPLTTEEICNDNEGYSNTWRPAKKYPLQDVYALYRCGNSKNKPFCDGTHTKIHFDGTESGNRVPTVKVQT